MRENTDLKNSEYGHFSRNVLLTKIIEEPDILFNISTQLFQKRDFVKLMTLSNEDLLIFLFSVVN